MSSREVNQMIRILPSYYEHLDKNKGTMIAKIFGMFEIRIDMFEPISVMIMQNTLPSVPDTELHYVFDMKGSQINREVLKDRSTAHLKNMKHTGGRILKDLDYIRLKEAKRFFKMDYESTKAILKDMQNDVDFLTSSRFMDYSLLFAVRRVDRNEHNAKVHDAATALWDRAVK